MQTKELNNRSEAEKLYDRIADVHQFTMKLNGYRSSVANYLRSLDLGINEHSVVLDAGCGTGLVTEALLDTGFEPSRSIALDLSFRSLEITRELISKHDNRGFETDEVQANVLSMPFEDETFDLVLMCGVLEYTPLDQGLAEAARVLKRDAKLVFLPVKPSLVGSVLELIYNFKIHPLPKVREAAAHHFKILGNHEFPSNEPISWSKTIFLLERK
jgi:ubiquinone/menaquinone biosynthesis C-methylase UbiE